MYLETLPQRVERVLVLDQSLKEVSRCFVELRKAEVCWARHSRDAADKHWMKVQQMLPGLVTDNNMGHPEVQELQVRLKNFSDVSMGILTSLPDYEEGVLEANLDFKEKQALSRIPHVPRHESGHMVNESTGAMINHAQEIVSTAGLRGSMRSPTRSGSAMSSSKGSSFGASANAAPAPASPARRSSSGAGVAPARAPASPSRMSQSGSPSLKPSAKPSVAGGNGGGGGGGGIRFVDGSRPGGRSSGAPGARPDTAATALGTEDTGMKSKRFDSDTSEGEGGGSRGRRDSAASDIE